MAKDGFPGNTFRYFQENGGDVGGPITINGVAIDAGASAVAKDSVASSSTRVLANKLTANDTQPAFQLDGNGTMKWGAGGASAPDCTLERQQAGVMRLLETALRVDRTSSTSAAFQARVTGESFQRIIVRTDGVILFGGAVAAVDTSLMRTGINVLATDSKFDPTAFNFPTKAGVPVDGDIIGGAADGDAVVDTTNSRLYVRIGGTWKSVALA